MDALTSMGYAESGLNAPQGLSYAEQKKAAGANASKLQIGMPSNVDQWQGNTALQQIQWVRTDGTMGVAIWDAPLSSSAWQTLEVWQAVGTIRGGRGRG